MSGSELVELEARPASIAEWEDLLVRLELMPRAVQHAIGDEAAAEGALPILRRLVDREREVSSWLLALSGATTEVPAAAQAGADARDLRMRFAALRSRTFTVVQRRGLEVWEWAAERERYGRMTVYQALTLLLREDAQVLAELRNATPRQKAPC